MNRAKPINVALHLVLTAALLGVVVSLVVAQSSRRAATRRAPTTIARTRSTRINHTGIGLAPKLPAWVTHRPLGDKLKQIARSWHPRGTRSRVAGDTGVTRQTILLTKANPNSVAFTFQASTAQDRHPFFSSDETSVYFDSDRNSATDSTENATGTYNIYRMGSDGGSVQQLTTDPGQHLEPNLPTGSTLLAYVGGGSITTGTDPVSNAPTIAQTAGFNLFVVPLNSVGATPNQLTGNTPANTFADVRHPSFSPGGTDIAFAGKRIGDTLYHIYTINVSSGMVTQYTAGVSNDYSPAWSPMAPNGSVIAFTTNATGYTSSIAPVISAGTKSTDDIFVVQPLASRPAPRRLTNFSISGQASTNRNPAWSTITPDNRTNGVAPNPTQPGIGRLMLAFASNRVDANNDGVPTTVSGPNGTGTTDIYFLDAPIGIDPTTGATTVTQVEAPFSSAGVYTGARKLSTTNPETGLDAADKPGSGIDTTGFDLTHTSSEDFPSFPQFQLTYRVVYQSDKNANLNIWASSILDLDAPTLLKYDEGNNEIVRVETLSGASLPTGRYVDAGTTVRFKVRAVDYQSGIKYAYLQIKCPDSQQQSDDRLEHKIFYFGYGQLDTTLFNSDHSAYEWDAQAIKATDTLTGPRFRPYLDPAALSQNAPPYLIADPGSPEFNWYTPGVEDFNAYSGNAAPPDDANLVPPGSSYKDGNSGFWLPLTQDPANLDTFTATWQTPIGFHSDMILDVVLYDNAVYPFDTTKASNWKIYDNIWGFTTRPFASNSQALYVSDYDTGQKFLNNRFGFSDFTTVGVTNARTGVQNQALLTFEGNPTEAWMTEFDSRLFTTVSVNPSTPPALPTPHAMLHFETPLGANSYGNNGQDPFVGVGPNGVPITGQYDIWRIQCRGPLPTAVLNLYGPRTSQPQPPDILATPPETTLRNPLIADRCVIWHSPYSGDLVVGPGTILDSDTQTNLKNFVNAGGRLFMCGQDIPFGLSLGQTQPPNAQGMIPQGNDFLNNTLRVTYVDDRAITNNFANDVINSGGAGRGLRPIGYETWFGPPQHSDFVNPNNVPDNPPLSQPPLYLGYTTINPTNHVYGCPNQGYDLQDANVPVGFPNRVTFLPPVPATLPPGATATFYPGLYGIDGTYSDGTPSIMWYRNATGGKVVFSPFGWEAINPAQQAIPMTNPVAYDWLNRRVELMHNVLDYLRTGRIVGTIRIRNASGSVTGVAQHAFVRALHADPLTGNTVTYGTAYTDSSGNYRIEGLDALGIYDLDAAAPGFITQHAQGVYFHGGYQAQSDQYIIQAQPGVVTGQITSLASGLPVAGAVVQAVDASDPTNTSPATFLSQPSDTSGNYVIRNLPASKYILSVTQASLTTLGFSGSVPATSAITVAPGQTISDPMLTSFKLTQPPIASVTGIVVVADASGNPTSIPIIGATVTPSLTTGTPGATLTPVQTIAPNGAFTFSGPTALAPGTYGLIASAPGYSPNATAVTFTGASGQSVTGIVIALKALPPGSLSGLVTSSPPISQPISGVTITVTDASGKTLTTTTGAVQTATLSDGTTYKFNYSVPGVNAGATVNVTAVKAGFTSKTTQPLTVSITTGAETRNVNFILDALYTFSSQLTLVSSPYQFPITAGSTTSPLVSAGDLFSIPGADVNSTFAFVTWDATTQKYVFYPNAPADSFHWGVGYFLQETNTAATLALTNPNGLLYPTDATGNYTPLNIPLKNGWNLIGDPYNAPLDLQKLQIIDATGAQVDVPTAQSGSNPALGGAVYTYENGSYEIVYTIDPFRGYWIRAFRPVTLVITAGAQQSRGVRGIQSRRAIEDISKETGTGWKVSLKATVGDGITQTGSKAYFGVSTHATDGYDIYKMPTPPSATRQAVQIAFNHADWGDKAAGYMADIRSTQNNAWEFTVTSNVPNMPVTLSWPGMATLSRRIDMQLVDLDTQQTVSLRSRSSIVIPASGDALTKRYRVEKKFASRSSELQLTNLTVTPSSASRSVGGGPTPVGISYNLSSEATVQVSILQGGRRIRTVHSTTRAAGANQENWDMKTDTGTTVATNVYTVEVRAINPATGRTVRQVQNVFVTR